MSKFLSLLCSLLICVATYAQEITVNGKVTANGEARRRDRPAAVGLRCVRAARV